MHFCGKLLTKCKSYANKWERVIGMFGIKAPKDIKQLREAAVFCRHNGLRFMEVSGEAPDGLPAQLEDIMLLPEGGSVYLREGSHREMEALLDSLSPGQNVVLLPESGESLPGLALWVNCWLNRKSGGQELWDVYDENRRPTGRLHPRGKELAPGDYHLVVHVWIRDSRGRYLLTKRSPNKGYGGMWESPGGAAQAGDDSLSACLREIREETGLRLDPERGRVVKSYTDDHFICDVWLFKQDFRLEDVVLQPGETCDRRYATKEEIRKMHREGHFVPFAFIDEVLEAN